MGGRQKDVENKMTTLTKSIMGAVLQAYSTAPKGEDTPLFMQDFLALDPRDRIKVATEFIKIVTPRNISIDDTGIRLTIEDKLAALAGDEAE